MHVLPLGGDRSGEDRCRIERQPQLTNRRQMSGCSARERCPAETSSHTNVRITVFYMVTSELTRTHTYTHIRTHAHTHARTKTRTHIIIEGSLFVSPTPTKHKKKKSSVLSYIHIYKCIKVYVVVSVLISKYWL